MQVRMIIIDPPSDGRVLDISLPSTVGRSREASIKLVHNQISRVHCEFFERDGMLYVRDLDSTNGTFVGDHRIRESAIRPGEIVTLGAVKLKAEYAPRNRDEITVPARVTDTIRNNAESTLQPATSKTTPIDVSPVSPDDSLHILPPPEEPPENESDLRWRTPDPPDDVPS
jgi:pSer/pThr/pTyr-binding forkhead associated (FHA) protein